MRSTKLLQRMFNWDQDHDGLYLNRKWWAVGLSFFFLQWALGFAMDFQPGTIAGPFYDISTAQKQYHRIPSKFFLRFSFGPFSIGIRIGMDNVNILPNSIPDNSQPIGSYALGAD